MRMSVHEVAPEAYKAMYGLEKYLRSSGLPDTVIDLVYLRVSQINGCAYCVDLHSVDLKKHGLEDRKIFGVAAWWEAPFYSPAERAALRLAEEATKIAITQDVSDEAWAEAAAHFEQPQLAALVMAIATMNAWNRIGVTTRMSPKP